MKVIHTVTGLRRLLDQFRKEGKTIGLVPTMGALHEGHLALVKRCVEENDVCVVSVFVNPTQFNNPEDLRLYPRNADSDVRLLEGAGAEVVFMPTVEEVYPEPDTRQFDFGALDKVMEGAFRPGHFNGVAQVVSKLFYFVEPEKSYFGEKDYQQLTIIREMVKQLQLPVEIVAVPIVRADDGLALSSRNLRLTDNQRKQAPRIYQVLSASVQWSAGQSPAEIVHRVTDSVDALPGLKVEYFEIVDGDSLQPVASWADSSSIIGAIAVYCGDVRLIDNIRYR